MQRLLRRRGLDPWEADGVQADPLVDESPALAGLSSASVQRRVALGPRGGRGYRGGGRARRTAVALDGAAAGVPGGLRPARQRGGAGGGSRAAGAAVPLSARPAVAQDRLLADGRVVLTLKSAWTDGARQLLFEPLTLLEKLAALIPRPRINLVLYHGVLARTAAGERGWWPAGRRRRP